MSLPEGFDPTPIKTAKLPALVVRPIHGVLPFDGALNPLTRSNTARRVSMTFATPATCGLRKVYHFGSGGEAAVALVALMSPDLHGIEVQLPPFKYPVPGKKRLSQHHFDLRVTFRDGFRRAIYVKDGSNLRTRKIQDEINAVFNWIPCGFADDAIAVNGDDFTRAYIDNLHRAWYHYQRPNPEADDYVEAVARKSSFWLLRDLMANCDLASAISSQCAMRLIGRGVLGVNWHAAINVHSRVWLKV